MNTTVHSPVDITEARGALMVNALGNRALGEARASLFTRDLDHEQQARVCAQQLIDVAEEHGHPWTLRSWNDHGLSMLMLGDITTAERSFTAVIEESAGRATPELTWAAGQLAALQLGRTHDAASYLHEALELAPPELPRELTTCLIHAGAIAHELDDPTPPPGCSPARCVSGRHRATSSPSSPRPPTRSTSTTSRSSAQPWAPRRHDGADTRRRTCPPRRRGPEPSRSSTRSRTAPRDREPYP